jgi:putative DNA primase/helicase
MEINFKEISELLLGGQHKHAKLFVKHNIEKYVIISRKGTHGYYFNARTKLWTELGYSQLMNDISDFLNGMIEKTIDHKINSSFDNKKKTKMQKYEDEDEKSFQKRQQKRIEREEVEKKSVAAEVKLFNTEKKNVARASHIKSIIEFVTHDFYREDFMNKLDVSEHIIPIKNGKVIDLKTLQTRDRAVTDYFTYELDVDYTPNTPSANKFFSQLMSDDKEKLKVFKRMLGYSITSNIDAKAYFVLIGCGDNGKSAVMRIIETVFKPLFVSIQKSLLFSENRMKQDMMPYLACLAGKRFGVYNEPSDALEMNESMVKAITGGDKVVAKKLYQDPFEFMPVVKMWILTNKIIKFDTCSEPMVKRTNLIPMNAQFVDTPTKKGQYKKNPDFVKELETTYRDEVFSFFAQGAYEYYQKKSFGYEDCKSLVKYRNDYIENIDPVRSFLKRWCIVDTKDKIKTSDLFEAFIAYCKKHDETMIPREKFYESLRGRKIVPVKINGHHYYHVTVRDEEVDDENHEDDIEDDEECGDVEDEYVNEAQPIKKSIVDDYNEYVKPIIENKKSRVEKRKNLIDGIQAIEKKNITPVRKVIDDDDDSDDTDCDEESNIEDTDDEDFGYFK